MLDIDGTLCEIVERPHDALIPLNVTASLRALNAAGDRVHVAFVTGRSTDDARRMLGVDHALIYGNHGMERLAASGNIRRPEGWDAEEPALREAARELATLAADFPGSHLEDKRFSLTLHYRGIDMTRLPELNARVGEVASRFSLRPSPGKRVINLVPEAAADKGDAVREVVREIGADVTTASIVFVGDDVTDEDGFLALSAMPNAVTVRVGDADAESAAEFSLDGPAEVHDLLELLAEAHT